MSDNVTKSSSRTDWDRLDAQIEVQIDTSDVPALTEEFFERAEVRASEQRVNVTVDLDGDVVAWFQLQGRDWKRRINAAARIYALAHGRDISAPPPAPASPAPPGTSSGGSGPARVTAAV